MVLSRGNDKEKRRLETAVRAARFKGAMKRDIGKRNRCLIRKTEMRCGSVQAIVVQQRSEGEDWRSGFLKCPTFSISLVCSSIERVPLILNWIASRITSFSCVPFPSQLSPSQVVLAKSVFFPALPIPWTTNFVMEPNKKNKKCQLPRKKNVFGSSIQFPQWLP
jgi:hypothetical protein